MRSMRGHDSPSILLFGGFLPGPSNRISALGIVESRFDQSQASQFRLELTTRKSFTTGVEAYPTFNALRVFQRDVELLRLQ